MQAEKRNLLEIAAHILSGANCINQADYTICLDLVELEKRVADNGYSNWDRATINNICDILGVTESKLHNMAEIGRRFIADKCHTIFAPNDYALDYSVRQLEGLLHLSYDEIRTGIDSREINPYKSEWEFMSFASKVLAQRKSKEEKTDKEIIENV